MSETQELPPSKDDAVEPVITRRRKLEEADMDITPMIDMTFLLLIFFIVTSKMGPKSGVELPPAKHGGAVVTKSAVILTVGAGEPYSRVYKGESVKPEDAFGGSNQEEQEAEIVAYVTAAIAPGSEKNTVLVQAGKGLKHREVARVARAVARAEIENLYVGVIEKN